MQIGIPREVIFTKASVDLKAKERALLVWSVVWRVHGR
jgi:hypothetical protein